MRAAYLTAPGKLELREVMDPTPGPGEIVLRVRAALTCGTDLKAYRRGHHAMPFPTPLGHEFAGEVVAVGDGVQRFPPGTEVMAVHSAPCGACRDCQRGQENLCAHAFSTMALGGFAEYMRLPARVVKSNTFVKPASLSFEQAAFLEPLSCVVQGLTKSGFKAGDTVIVLGSGAIGLMHLVLARKLGAEQVVVVGRGAERLALAARLGADLVIDARESQATERACEATDGGADLVIECAGMPAAWEAAPALARRGGRVLLFGGCKVGTWASFDTRRLHYDELTLVGSFHFTPRAVAEAQQLLAKGSLDLTPLISERQPLANITEVFARMDRGVGLKYALTP